MHALTLPSVLFALGGFMGFSLCDVISRMLLQQGYPQAQVLTALMPIALAIMVVYISVQRAWRSVKLHQPKLVALLVLLACGEAGCAFYALGNLTYLAEAYALFFTLPMWAALLGWLWLGEKISRLQLLAVLIGFAGVLCANWPSEGTSPLSLGHLAALGAPFLSSIRILITRKVSQSGNSYGLLLALFGGLFIFNGVQMDDYVPFKEAALGLVLLGGLMQATAHICMVQALTRMPAALLAPFQYSQALWGVLLGIVLFSEWPRLNVYAGLVLVVAGGILLLRPARGTASPAPS
jgi:S-adenosylmethionine uptake transporter